MDTTTLIDRRIAELQELSRTAYARHPDAPIDADVEIQRINERIDELQVIAARIVSMIARAIAALLEE